MAKAKKLPSGSWRVQVYVGRADGKKIMRSVTAPSKVEAEYQALQLARGERVAVADMTVGEAIDKYIETRSNVLSPSTLQGYRKIRNNNLQFIMDKKLNRLTQAEIQAAVNEDAKTLSSKSIKNAHGLLSAALSVYRPDMRLKTSIPQQKKKFMELPPPQKIFDAVCGTDIELPVLLAMWLSFSMSEIRGIMKSDIKDGILTLNRVVVDVDNKPVVKDTMKAYERSRRLVVPPYIMGLINKCDTEFIVTLDSYAIKYRWRRIADAHDIGITFHGLRHVNASVMHLLGVPDKYAMERGGWKTDQTMKAVYQNIFTEERIEVDRKIDTFFENIVSSHDSTHGNEKSPI